MIKMVEYRAIEFFKKPTPENTKEKFCILTDNQNIAKRCRDVGYAAFALSNEKKEEKNDEVFTVKQFNDYLENGRQGAIIGYPAQYYDNRVFILDLPPFLEKPIIEILEEKIIDYTNGRKMLFSPYDSDRKEYENFDNKRKVEKAIETFINKYEGKHKFIPNNSITVKDIVEKLHTMKAYANYETTDKGFGKLYADIFKDKHRYNPSIKDFMYYDGQKWVEDTEGLFAKNDAKILSDALLVYSVEVGGNDYSKSVMSLCNLRNRNSMLNDSKDVYFFNNEQLDEQDYILNVQNGTLDLRELEPKFMEHTSDMLLSKICNVDYDPNAQCKHWHKFLYEIMQGDADKIKYLQKIAGLSLTGNTEEEACFILYGSTTRNGKSTYCETLIHLLGSYALTMKPESLAVKQNIDSRQASGDIARLKGARFVNASEPPKRMLFDTALLKSLLGRDSITARHLHQREFSFIPKFKLVINTNYLPTITDDTVFSSGRINVVSFDRHFEPHEQDKHLKERLRSEEELSGILNWCLEGLRLYREEGLEPPQAVKDATNTYRTDSDKIGNFINECLVKTGRNSKAKDIYDVYEEWCRDNGFGVENKSNFFAEMKNKGLFALTGTVNGKTEKNVIRGYEIDKDNISADLDFCTFSDSDSPFD